jgi:hypothetical protein
VLAAIEDASDVVDRRFVTCTHEAKMPEILSDLSLAAAAPPSLSAWHDSASQRSRATLSERPAFPGDQRRRTPVEPALTLFRARALTVAG